MPRPPAPEQVRWFTGWLGPRGTMAPLPPDHDHTVALLHPGTVASDDGRSPEFRGPLRGELGEDQKLLLARLLLAVSGSRRPATSATWEPRPDLPPQRPLDLGVRVAADVDWLLVAGRLDALVWPIWEERLVDRQPISALWPDDHAWCVWSDPRLAFTVLAGSAELCERVLEAPALRGQKWSYGAP